MHHYNNSSLKRVQSEGKLLFGLDKNNNNQNINKFKNLSKHPQNKSEQIKTNLNFPTPPAMGISSRKIDPRDYGRLVRMKKASRSQPQLSELFNNNNDSSSEKGRNNNINRNLSNRENFNRYSNNKQQKSKRAPPPPTIIRNKQDLQSNYSPNSLKNKIDKENEIYAIVNVKGNSVQNQKYLQGSIYRESSLNSPQSFINEQQHYKQSQFNNCSTQHQFSPHKQIQSRLNHFTNNNTTIAASNYSDELLPQVVGFYKLIFRKT